MTPSDEVYLTRLIISDYVYQHVVDGTTFKKCIHFFNWLTASSTHCFDFLQFFTELFAQRLAAVHGARIVDSSDWLVFFAFLLIYHHCQSPIYMLPKFSNLSLFVFQVSRLKVDFI